MFFQFITKDERRKVIKPFFAYAKEAMKMQQQSWKNSRDSWAVSSLPLRIWKTHAQKSIGFSTEIYGYRLSGQAFKRAIP
jgi:hypothetical protein